MANVVRFTLPTAVNLDVPGVGTFIAGVLDVDANNASLVTRARFRLYAYQAAKGMAFRTRADWLDGR